MSARSSLILRMALNNEIIQGSSRNKESIEIGDLKKGHQNDMEEKHFQEISDDYTKVQKTFSDCSSNCTHISDSVTSSCNERSFDLDSDEDFCKKIDSLPRYTALQNIGFVSDKKNHETSNDNILSNDSCNVLLNKVIISTDLEINREKEKKTFENIPSEESYNIPSEEDSILNEISKENSPRYEIYDFESKEDLSKETVSFSVYKYHRSKIKRERDAVRSIDTEGSVAENIDYNKNDISDNDSLSEFSCDDPLDEDFNLSNASKTSEDSSSDDMLTDSNPKDDPAAYKVNKNTMVQVTGQVETNDINSDYSNVSHGSHFKENTSTSLTRNSNKNLDLIEPLPEQILRDRYRNRKHVRCRYCDIDIISKNFVRHLERHHADEKDVKQIFEYPKSSKQRRQALSLLRNDINFDLYLKGCIRPGRQNPNHQNLDYYPCAYCKRIIEKDYLGRHAKSCLGRKLLSSEIKRPERQHHLAESQTLTSCALDPTNVISKLNIKKEVFDKMRADNISFEVKRDLLIAHYGESYYKSQKREKKEYTCSSKMRDVARLLLTYREITNLKNVSLKDIFHPKHFDNVLLSARTLAGYNPVEKTFESPSTAIHMGTALKVCCDELIHLILKESNGFQTKTKEESLEWQQNIKNFKLLVETRWNNEISSLAHKDLHGKRIAKPLLIPLVSDIKIFRDGVLTLANQCKDTFLKEADTVETYKLLVQCLLALVILFNRRRIGDVQYLKIKQYMTEQKSNFEDFQDALTETEKMLANKYKRVVTSGKGSRSVVILVPEILQDYFTILLKSRVKYISPRNEYVFALPGSTIEWGQGDVAIRSLTKQFKLESPMAITSNRLRKHIATVMQILNMSNDESKQFSKFMGHTEKTHAEFYEIPIDIYQTAKISKILLMMEKGIPVELKGKSLAEVNFDPNLEYADYDNPKIAKQGEVENPCSSNGLGSSNTDETEECEVDRPCVTECIEVDDASSGGDETSRKIKKGAKAVWTKKEIDDLERWFRENIDKGTYPPGKSIKDFIAATKSSRKITVVRAKIQHLIKKK